MQSIGQYLFKITDLFNPYMKIFKYYYYQTKMLYSTLLEQPAVAAGIWMTTRWWQRDSVVDAIWWATGVFKPRYGGPNFST